MSFQDVRLAFRPTNNRTVSLNEIPSTPSTMTQSIMANSFHNYQRDDINVGRSKNSPNNGRHRYSSSNLAVEMLSTGRSYESYMSKSYDSSYDTLEPTDRAPGTLIKPVIRPRAMNISKQHHSDYLGKKQKVKLVKEKQNFNPFSLVSSEILQFQQMVSSLGQQIYGLGNAPAELWKCRLQIDTMNEISKRIETQLQTHEKALSNNTSPDRGTLIKLTRDYKHVQNSFKNLKLEFGQRQKMNDLRLMQEEMIKKSYTEDSDQRIRLQMKEEEYVHKVMRERESEILNINQKMHQVSNIYKDLGHIVNSQQEQIDMIEDNMYTAKDNAAYGLEQLEKANGKTTPKSYAETEDEDDDEDEYTQITQMQSPRSQRSLNEEGCQLPDMETIKEYLSDGKTGIMDFMEYGTNQMEFAIDKVLEVKTNLMQCVSASVTNYRYRNRKNHTVIDIG